MKLSTSKISLVLNSGSLTAEITTALHSLFISFKSTKQPMFISVLDLYVSGDKGEPRSDSS